MKKNKDENFDGCVNTINVIAIIFIFFFSFYHWYHEINPTNLEGFIRVIAGVIITTVLFGGLVFAGAVIYLLMIAYLGLVIYILNFSWEFFEPKTFTGFMFFTLLALVEIGVLIGIPVNFIYSVDKDE